MYLMLQEGFLGGSVVKTLPVTQEMRFNRWVRKIPSRRKWQLLRYSCLGNPMDRGAWCATVHRGAEEWDTTKQQQKTTTKEIS